MSEVPPVITPAAANHTATIIFLHGLGDTGHGWARKIGSIKPRHAKLICPTADEIPVTIYDGEKMPSWYDGRQDVDGVQKASQLITKMIDEEIKAGIPASRILLGGFSQGAALSLYTGLTGPNLLGGIVALSGYVPILNTINWNKVQKPVVFQGHGDRDGDGGKVVAYLLKKFNLPNYTSKTYKGLGHSYNEQEMRDVAKFMNERIPPE